MKMLHNVVVRSLRLLSPKRAGVKGYSSYSPFQRDRNTIITEPLFRDEILDHLDIPPNGRFLDMTFGAGGHSALILKHLPTCHLLASDCDPKAEAMAEEFALVHSDSTFSFIKAKFSDLPNKLFEYGFGLKSFDGILIDPGFSFLQEDRYASVQTLSPCYHSALQFQIA